MLFAALALFVTAIAVAVLGFAGVTGGLATLLPVSISSSCMKTLKVEGGPTSDEVGHTTFSSTSLGTKAMTDVL